jgi:hypothetical protein
MEHIKQPGYNKYVDLAEGIWDILELANGLRDDLVVFALFHSEKLEDGSVRIASSGRLLSKLMIESKFTTVLHARVQQKEGKLSYELGTCYNNSTAKSPAGLFNSPSIPNDYKMVADAIREYEK